MKRILIIVSCILLYSCGPQIPDKPDFILGDWIRLNNAQGKETFEIWKDDFTGIGYTMKGKDTTFVEILSFVEIDGKLVYKVEGVNEQPTLFTITEISTHSFICENPQNEFPKKIQYEMVSDTLKAVISAGENSIEFLFVKSAN